MPLNPYNEDSVRVLIADDDRSMRDLLRAAIASWGYDIIEAKDGEEVWEIMQKPNPPHILVLDWLMPKLDGLTLCKKLRSQLDYYPYIIFLTQVSGTQNAIRGLEAGADEFMIKPINFSELRTRIYAGERVIKCLDIIEAQKTQINFLQQLLMLEKK